MARTVEMGNPYIPVSLVGELAKVQLPESLGRVLVNSMLVVELEAIITITKAPLQQAAVGAVVLEA